MRRSLEIREKRQIMAKFADQFQKDRTQRKAMRRKVAVAYKKFCEAQGAGCRAATRLGVAPKFTHGIRY